MRLVYPLRMSSKEIQKFERNESTLKTKPHLPLPIWLANQCIEQIVNRRRAILSGMNVSALVSTSDIPMPLVGNPMAVNEFPLHPLKHRNKERKQEKHLEIRFLSPITILKTTTWCTYIISSIDPTQTILSDTQFPSKKPPRSRTYEPALSSSARPAI